MQTLAGAEDALYQHWDVPGKPIAIYLSRAVTGAILLEGKRGLIPRRRPEVGGILLGSVRTQDTVTVRVEACCPLPCEHLFGPSYSLSETDKETLRQVVAEYPVGVEGQLCTVGFYRTHTRRGLNVDSDDLQLAELFPEGADLVLLLKPRRLRKGRGAFFFWQDAQIAADTPAIRFAVPRRASREFAAVQEGAAREPAVAEAAAEEPAEPPVALRASRWNRWWRSLWLQTPLAACLLCAWYLMGYAAGSQIDKVVPHATPPPRDPFALSLIVLQYGENLHLSWDRQARAVAAAQHASLQISDAGQNRTLDLSASDLRNGAVAYHRMSEHVQFRLEVFLPGRRSISETWDSSEAARGN